MKLYNAILVLFLASTFPFANALVVNDDAFVKNGGNINDTQGTYRTPYFKLTEASFASQFLSVGTIPGCTATWIGDSEDKKSIYVLTAAHCIPYDGESGNIDIPFWDYKGKLVGENGTYSVPPQRINKPAGYGGASTDIAILKLRKVRSIVDKAEKAITAPLLNDQPDEVGKVVHFAGYGTWGTAKDGNQGSWFPTSGPRRAWGTSKVNGVWEMDHGIGAGFSPTGDEFWARVAPGDSGSAWWQEDKGKFYIIAATNGGGSGSTGSRVSAYQEWIKGVAPEVRWRSSRPLPPSPPPVVVKNYACFHLAWLQSAQKWDWVKRTHLRTKSRCIGMNLCAQGGACYKWDEVN